MSLQTVASIIGIGSGAASLFGGGGGGIGGTNAYQPQHQGEADTGWQQLLQQFLSGQGGANAAIQPNLSRSYQDMLNLPMQQQYGGLSNLAQMFQQILGGQAGTSAQAQQNLMGAGNQLWNTAQDPQNALRNKMQQQVTDASRAGTSARGIGMGGEAAGIENQDVSNFLMNWQNQQLGRQAQGLQGMTGAYGQAGQQGQNVGANLTGSMGFGAMSPQFLQQGASWPMTASNMYSGAENQLLQQMLAGMGGIGSYLGQGTNASNVGFGQQQTGLGNLNYSLGNLAQLFRPSPNSGGGGGYGGSGQTDVWAQGGWGT